MFRWFERKGDTKPEDTTTATRLAGEDHDDPQSGLSSLKSALTVTGRSFFGLFGGNRQGDDQSHEAEPERFADNDDFNDALDEIEEVLIRADVGPRTAADITDRLRVRRRDIKTRIELTQLLRQEFLDVLAPYEKANSLTVKPGTLNVYLVTGVNGAGKTTFIGKLAHRFIKDGKKVVIGAGDTFRAAAEEQLETWAQRSGAEFVGMGKSKDPASVIFEALKRARETNADVALLDTAGRLQNKANLMAELQKVRRVIDQGMPADGVLESLLVLDATTGQNGLSQASVFKEAVGLDGVVLTKLDSSSRGGIVLTIAREHQLPVKLVGVGEGIEDLRDFHAEEFVEGLFGR